MLAEGGADTPENTAVLFPNCRRRLHYGANRSAEAGKLRVTIAARGIGTSASPVVAAGYFKR